MSYVTTYQMPWLQCNRPNIVTESDEQVDHTITIAWSAYTSVKCPSVRRKQ